MKKLLVLLITIAFAAACGPPTRDRAVTKTARKVCKRAEQCGTLDDNYSSYNECLTDWENTFYDGWSESNCDNGQIDPVQLDECHTQIETFDCDGNGLDVLGLLLTSCSAAQVCSN